jgi:hypothetical protein
MLVVVYRRGVERLSGDREVSLRFKGCPPVLGFFAVVRMLPPADVRAFLRFLLITSNWDKPP